MNQGNFLTQNEFTIYDYNHKRKYKGKLFLFQNCVACTECLSSGKLQFKSYFPNQTGQIECINETKFMLYERNNYKIQVSGASAVIQQWMEQVRKVLMPAPGNGDDRLSTISNVNSIKNSDSKMSTRITKDLESIFDANFKRHASSDSLSCDHSDKESNITNVENRKSNSDCSSADSTYFTCVTKI